MPTPIEFARQELAAGVSEPEAYPRYTGGRDEAWCAHFVSWAYAQAGHPLPGYFLPTPQRRPPTAGCNHIMRTMVEGRHVLPPGERPRVNDLIFYKRRVGGVFEQPGYYGLPFVYGHIGIVDKIERDPKTGQEFVITIEGNYSDRVALVRTKLNDPSIGGFARPVDFEASGLPTLLAATAFGAALAWKIKRG